MPRKATDKQQVVKLIKKLRRIFSRVVRLSAADSRGMCRCVTCGKRIHWKKAQAGHWMSAKTSPALLFHVCNVHVQCCYCNVYCEGMQEFHGDYIETAYGIGVRKELKRQALQPKAWTLAELNDLIAHFSEELADLMAAKAGIL